LYSARDRQIIDLGVVQERRVAMRHLRRASLLLAVGAGLVLAPGAGAGGQGGYGCPVGFEIGPVTLEQVFALPRVQAGLAAGAYDSSYVVASFTQWDKNGNGFTCIKDVAALNGAAGPWQYFYNIIDDNSAARSG
jgi:hypothetical protein